MWVLKTNCIMKILFFLLLPTSALCQSIEFFEAAGINPRHFESIGKDEGWVEYWLGPMTFQDGQVFKITLPEWESIDTIFVNSYNNLGPDPHYVIVPEKNAKGENWIGVFWTKKARFNILAPWCFYRYTVKRKKA